jgi:hypothetical protein
MFVDAVLARHQDTAGLHQAGSDRRDLCRLVAANGYEDHIELIAHRRIQRVSPEPNRAGLLPLDTLQPDAFYGVNVLGPPIEKRTGHTMLREVERESAPNRARANDGDRR